MIGVNYLELDPEQLKRIVEWWLRDSTIFGDNVRVFGLEPVWTADVVATGQGVGDAVAVNSVRIERFRVELRPMPGGLLEHLPSPATVRYGDPDAESVYDRERWQAECRCGWKSGPAWGGQHEARRRAIEHRCGGAS